MQKARRKVKLQMYQIKREIKVKLAGGKLRNANTNALHAWTTPQHITERESRSGWRACAHACQSKLAIESRLATAVQ